MREGGREGACASFRISPCCLLQQEAGRAHAAVLVRPPSPAPPPFHSTTTTQSQHHQQQHHQHPTNTDSIGADEALERVQRSHDSRNAGGDGASPEAAAQREAVRAFVAAL